VIPALGFGSAGPVLLLFFGAVAVILVLGVISIRTQLKGDAFLARRLRYGLAGMVLGSLVAATAAFAPYEGDNGRRCHSATAAYGVGVGTLVNPRSADPCEGAGALLALTASGLMFAQVTFVGIVLAARLLPQ
jgi:hypothetical protein